MWAAAQQVVQLVMHARGSYANRANCIQARRRHATIPQRASPVCLFSPEFAWVHLSSRGDPQTRRGPWPSGGLVTRARSGDEQLWAPAR